ncbi:hypothetical protein ADUPG1_008552 [Aduncisulcus paluster]|uniref:Peptidase A2 domain-containing protein n=1 Tax=Aduncisulcus paluster TaxID=2918883 RepID=A0ABQ5KWG8_9EUKA|nr:hypothetical protein ADUPG1_008552 [Aduncisulcus paluster]
MGMTNFSRHAFRTRCVPTRIVIAKFTCSCGNDIFGFNNATKYLSANRSHKLTFKGATTRRDESSMGDSMRTFMSNHRSVVSHTHPFHTPGRLDTYSGTNPSESVSSTSTPTPTPPIVRSRRTDVHQVARLHFIAKRMSSLIMFHQLELLHILAILTKTLLSDQWWIEAYRRAFNMYLHETVNAEKTADEPERERGVMVMVKDKAVVGDTTVEGGKENDADGDKRRRMVLYSEAIDGVTIPKRLCPLERDVTQYQDPREGGGPWVDDIDDLTIGKEVRKEIEDLSNIPGVGEQLEALRLEKGAGGTVLEQIPVEILAGKTPFNASKPLMESNWKPGCTGPVDYKPVAPLKADSVRDFNLDTVNAHIMALTARKGCKCMTMDTGDDSKAGVVTVTVYCFKTGTRKVKCLFDTGADISLNSTSWLDHCGYSVGMKTSELPVCKQKKLFGDMIRKADKPLVFTVFGGGKITCTLRLQKDVPMIVGRDGMESMHLSVGVKDIRGYRSSVDQRKEIELVLKQLSIYPPYRCYHHHPA